MSSPPGSESETTSIHSTRLSHHLGHVPHAEQWSNRAMHLIRAFGFWAAIVLPFLHIPLLLSGLTTRAEVIAFVTLVAANIVAIRLGMDHRRS